MWSANVNGSWLQVGTDADLVEWARTGRLRRDSPVHHSSLPTSGLAGQVHLLEPYFGPPPAVHDLARTALHWGFGSFLCGIAAPMALFLGLRARSEIRAAPGRYTNAGDATAAIIIGSIMLGIMFCSCGFGVLGAMMKQP